MTSSTKAIAITPDDVERLTHGKPSKNRVGSRQIRHRLRLDERERLEIARSKGFLLLTGSTRAALKNAWYLDCQARHRPCVYVERLKEGLSVTTNAGTHHLANFEELADLLGVTAHDKKQL
jgi:hypothetical protein